MKDEDRRLSSTRRQEIGLPSDAPTPAAQVVIIPAKKPAPASPEQVTWGEKLRHLMDATETRVKMLKRHHVDQVTAMQAEIDRATHALSEERQAHQLTKHKLGAANNEIDRLTHIAVNAAADAFGIITEGGETLGAIATELFQLYRAMIAETEVSSLTQTEVAEKFQRIVATMGLRLTPGDVNALVATLFSPDPTPDPARPEDEGDRATQVGHEPPHGK